MNETETIGGVGLKEVITFQTQIMMGAQFKRVKNTENCKDAAKNRKDIIIACLRIGWNDAFRHTSENVKNEGGKSVLELENAERRKNGEEAYDDFICKKILDNEKFLAVFYEYAKAESPRDKLNAVKDEFNFLKEHFKAYKKIEGEKQLCFGHFQKMFNIALKLYLCLYLCRTALDIKDVCFCEAIVGNLKNADCPVDSIILNHLKEKTGNKVFGDYKWSKFGTEKYDAEGYINVQEKISELKKEDKSNLYEDKSNLYYDFYAWGK